MSKQPVRRPWKKHKQELVSLNCGVRCEVDKKISSLIQFLNYNRIETRHSCEGGKGLRGYVSMFATPTAVGLAHYLLDNGVKLGVVIERETHPFGYDNLTIRWRKQNQKSLEKLIHKYFA